LGGSVPVFFVGLSGFADVDVRVYQAREFEHIKPTFDPVAKRHTKDYNWTMKYFSWSEEKNELLKIERGLSFEEVAFYIDMGFLLDVLEHPNQEKYQGQKIFVVQIEEYVYLVPFVESEHEIFLKTIIPSRKATKRYLKGSEE
jgi:uncharacterized DUF497 family protein